jgi:hypothetical protein
MEAALSMTRPCLGFPLTDSAGTATLRLWWGLLGLAVVALTGPAAAQQVGVRVGAGPAAAGEFGLAGLLAVHLRTGALLVRVDGRAVTTSEGTGAQSGSKVLSGGIAVGWTSPRSSAALRPYALATAGLGLDVRESDAVMTFGAAVGLDRLFWRYLFGEISYEYWSQHGVQYYDLPKHTVSLVVGIGVL